MTGDIHLKYDEERSEQTQIPQRVHRQGMKAGEHAQAHPLVDQISHLAMPKNLKITSDNCTKIMIIKSLTYFINFVKLCTFHAHFTHGKRVYRCNAGSGVVAERAPAGSDCEELAGGGHRCCAEDLRRVRQRGVQLLLRLRVVHIHRSKIADLRKIGIN